MSFQHFFKRKIIIVLATLAILQFLALVFYLRYSNLNQKSDSDLTEKLLFQAESKLLYFRQIILSMEPQNEAIIRAIHGDIVALIYLISTKLGQSPIDIYQQLSLNNSAVESYINGQQPVIAVLVVACNRSDVLRTLSQIINGRPNKNLWPLIVSQGCESNTTKNAILKHKTDIAYYGSNIPNVSTDSIKIQFRGYYRIAAHFKLALDYAFEKVPAADALIIVEDDLDIAPDFFEYFAATYRVLKEDPTLYCVSGFNDNGRPNLIDSTAHSTLYRTDFFPGLGWMLLRSTWKEIRTNWPTAFWDDHLRSFSVHRMRSCIRPEISRSLTYGQIGVSNGLFFKKYLETIILNQNFVPFASQNLSHLHRENYDALSKAQLAVATTVTVAELLASPDRFRSPVKIAYLSSEFGGIADSFGLMSDLRDGLARTSYKGVVTFFWHSVRVFLVPAVSA